MGEEQFFGKDCYLINKEINRGGFGVVYEAKDVRDGKIVAIKKFQPSNKSTNVMERADRKGIGKLIEEEYKGFKKTQGLFGESFPIFYEILPENKGFVMEFIVGLTLKEWIKSAGDGLSRDEFHDYFNKGHYLKNAKDIAIKTIRPICILHALNIVHGDIKPDNFMVDRGWGVKCIDFGYTNDGKLISSQGAREYHIDGEKPSFRSDIFSLGVTLYEISTREHPIPHVGKKERIESMKNFKEHYENLEKRIETIQMDMAGFSDLKKAILKCINPDPDKRYTDAGELMAAVSPESLIEVVDRLRESTKYEEALNLLLKLKEHKDEDITSKKIAMELRINHYLGKKVSIEDIPSYYRDSIPVLNRVARILRDSGHITLALEFVERAKEKYEQTKSKAISAANLHYTFGTIYALSGDFEKAKEELIKSLKSREKDRDFQGAPYCLKELAQINIWEKRYGNAKENLEGAFHLMKVSEEEGKIDNRAKSYVYLVKSRVELENGSYQKAKESLEIAKSLIVDTRVNYLCDLQWGFYYLRKGETQQARSIFEKLRNSDIGQVKVESLIGLYNVTRDEAVKEEARTFCKENGLGYYLKMVDRLR